MTGPNVFVFVIDTLRYDYAETVWQVVKERGFTKYENTIAPSSWTTPSHASIFTGMYPIVHGAHATRSKKVDQVKLSKGGLLTTELRSLGYTNYLFSSNPYISKYYGFKHFDEYFETLYVPELKLIGHKEWENIQYLRKERKNTYKIARELIRQGKNGLLVRLILEKFGMRKILSKIYELYSKYVYKWPLEKGSKKMYKAFKHCMADLKKEEGLFMFFNLMEVHEPYFKEKKLRYELNFNKKEYEKDVNEKLLEQLKKAYCKEINYVGGSLDKFLAFIEKTKNFDNSFMIITSDHGQLFGEGDKLGHGVFLNNEVLKVPLFIKYPKGKKIDIYQNKDREYISLKNIKKFIINNIEKDVIMDVFLYEKTVFAESYGINIPLKFKCGVDKDIVEYWDRYRIAIYHKGAKGIFDPGKWRFDSIEFEDGGGTEKDAEKVLKHQIMQFLKKGTSKDPLRNIY